MLEPGRPIYGEAVKRHLDMYDFEAALNDNFDKVGASVPTDDIDLATSPVEVPIRDTLDAPGAAMCEIMVDKNQNFAPKVSSRRLEDGSMVTAPMEDMAPFLPRDELVAVGAQLPGLVHDAVGYGMGR